MVTNHITQNANDKKEIEPALNALNSLPASLGKVDSLLADAGYFSRKNIDLCAKEGIQPYISTNRDKHNLTLEQRFPKEPEPIEIHLPMR
ncbi:hypothetical protein MASR1M12_03910 [Erysipelotrichia bacterium]